ncbi:MAG TPA: MmcQ/YjbR family DNA-binding protein [Gemmatimonadaceae bacterium]|nr:MmcQ/YjbR family DNA-binding protein [Gemmatimonadaceae bacterium]
MPEADEAFPWGERAIRVKKKAFLFMRLEGKDLSFSVKLSESRQSALALDFTEPTHYGLGKHGWVTARVTKASRADAEGFEEWIAESYRLVAPQKLARAVVAE